MDAISPAVVEEQLNDKPRHFASFDGLRAIAAVLGPPPPRRVGVRLYTAVVTRHLRGTVGDRGLDLLPHLWVPAVPTLCPVPHIRPAPSPDRPVLDPTPPADRARLLAGPDRPGLRVPLGLPRSRMARRGQPLLVLADLLPHRGGERDPSGVVPVYRDELLPVPSVLRLGGVASPARTAPAAPGGVARRSHPDRGQLRLPLLGPAYPYCHP